MMRRDVSTSRIVNRQSIDNATSSTDTYNENVTETVGYGGIDRNASVPNRLAHTSRRSETPRVSKSFDAKRGADKVDPFGDYAETDLDQPTDYSLRYAENDTDEDEKQNVEYFRDTVKTYCTEDTPYETPFTFSTSTSMLDLRLEDGKENVDRKAPEVVDQVTTSSFAKQADSLHELGGSVLVTKKEDPAVILNLGQVTPKKKIVNYYEEEVHGFSRNNSFNSLISSAIPQNNIPEVMSEIDLFVCEEKLENDDQHAPGCSQMGLKNESVEDKQAVANEQQGEVKFYYNYYMDETPMMFSRCSSLGSLSGFEQVSIHDDHSSVLSNFSLSGAITPSELPDSPSQMVMPNHLCNRKIQNTEFMQEETVKPSVQQPFSKSQVSGIFKDAVANFERISPIEFSTNVNSLTNDLENNISHDDSKVHKLKDKLKELINKNEKDTSQLETDMLNMTISGSESKAKEEQVSDGDEDDEDMLAACINMGMQTSRYRQSFKILNSQKSVQSKSPGIASYQRNFIPSRLESHVIPVDTSIAASKPNRPAMEMIASDTVHVYCTEDTPADISPVGSQTNLSVLSMPSVQEDVEKIKPDKPTELECHRRNLFDESSNLSGEDEEILNECIQSGIPKVKQICPLSMNISFEKKSETTHKFNGTPSSPIDIHHNYKDSTGLDKSTNSWQLDEVLENSPNSQSDDEMILTECIQSAMPKATFNWTRTSRGIRPFSMHTADKPKLIFSSTPSVFYSKCAEQRKTVAKKHFEDNVGFSEKKKDVMLTQCVRSGRPKASSTTMASMPKKVVYVNNKAAGIFPISSSSCCISKPYPRVNDIPHASYRSTNVNPVDVCSTKDALDYNCFRGKSTNSAATQITSETFRNCDTCERMYCIKRSSSHHDQYHLHHQHCQHCYCHHHHHHAENKNDNNPVDNLVCMRSHVECNVPRMFNRTENYDDYLLEDNVVPIIQFNELHERG